QIAGVDRVFLAAAGGQVQLKVVALEGQRRFDVVIENVTIRKRKSADTQLQQSLAERLAGADGARNGRHIRGAILFRPNVNLRLADDNFGKRNLAAPEGIYTETSADLLGGEQRQGVGRLLAMNNESVDGGLEGEPLDGKTADFALAARDGIDALDSQAAKQR